MNVRKTPIKDLELLQSLLTPEQQKHIDQLNKNYEFKVEGYEDAARSVIKIFLWACAIYFSFFLTDLIGIELPGSEFVLSHEQWFGALAVFPLWLNYRRFNYLNKHADEIAEVMRNHAHNNQFKS